MKPYQSFKIKQFNKEGFFDTEDEIVIETYHTIYVNGQELVSILCSPHDREYLTVGFLFTSGIINDLEDILENKLEENKSKVTLKENIDIEERKGKNWTFGRIISTPCGSPGFWLQLTRGLHLDDIQSDLKVKWDNLLLGTRALNKPGTIHHQTGGTHIVGIFDPQGNMKLIAEDVGRHNAIDRVVGEAKLKKIDLTKHFLACSGRISSDMISKITRVKIPIIISLTSPTSTGIQAADKLGITLIGFARGNKMNVYTHSERVIPNLENNQ
ncbi:MAG: formate dehydrogenase accessory sulfurtransferase FdhD [Candidatus Ranarchaeia archaeon]